MNTTYRITFRIETERNTQTEVLESFDNIEIAKKEFRKTVKNANRCKTSDEDAKEYLAETIVLEKWIDNDFEEDIDAQIIYSEGVIDRMNYKGSYAVNYYYYATYNGRELMHEMYFQGKKQMWVKKHKVAESQLKDWYYRN